MRPGVLAAGLLLAGAAGGAQQPLPPAPAPRDTLTPPDTAVPLPTTTRPGGRAPVPCAGQPVRDVVVLAQPPYTTGFLRRLEFVSDLVQRMHATTRSEVVRRYMLLHPGQACDELRRAESERILRVQPFLVDARVVPYATDDGGVVLEVETRDEFSLITEVAVRTAAPPITVLRVGEQNLLGRGVQSWMEWRDGGVGYRDGAGFRLTHYQAFGRPYQLSLEARRYRVGGEWRADFAHPYFTDLQRIAWRVTGGREDDHLQLLRRDVRSNAVFFRREWVSAGGVLRVGVPGRLSLFGFSAGREVARTTDRVVILGDSGIVADDGPPLGFRPSERYPGQDVVRLSLLWGVRNLRFVPVAGFESLTGVQDVRRGFQLSTVFGRGAAFLGSEDDDYYVSADLYMGAGTPRVFSAMELQAEGRRESRREQWNGVVTSGRWAGYLVPNDRLRFVADVEYAGVWRARVPMQLELGAREGGVRGFNRADLAGGRRGVARLETRWVLGRPFNLGDIGVASFGDVGRIWAGDAPYGVTTPVRASAGIGLLGAFPARSRRLWRVDVARALTPERGAGWQVIFSNRDLTRQFWREPRDVQEGRERAVPSSVFTFP